MKWCGCKESCFVPGSCWGHFEGVMCAHMGERGTSKPYPNHCEGYCALDGQLTVYYGTVEDYENLKSGRAKTDIDIMRLRNMGR